MKLSSKNRSKDKLAWAVAPTQDWSFSEWQKFELKLWRLPLKKLRKIASNVGINFVPSNKSAKNKKEFILVFDEASKEDLLREYKRVLKERE